MCVLFAYFFWWYADGADEELGTAINDDINEDGEFPLGVVIAGRLDQCVHACRLECSYLVFLAEPPT